MNEMDIMTEFRSKQEEQNFLSKGILGLLKLKSLLRNVDSVKFSPQMELSMYCAMAVYKILYAFKACLPTFSQSITLAVWQRYCAKLIMLNNEFICLDKNPYYKASEEDKSGFVSLNFPASDNCEIYFKAKKSTSVIHLRLSDFLSPEDAIDVYDPYTNEFQIRYRGTDKLLKSVTSKSDSARVVFVRGGSQDATRIRFEIVHRALPQGKYGQAAACLLQVLLFAKQTIDIRLRSHRLLAPTVGKTCK